MSNLKLNTNNLKAASSLTIFFYMPPKRNTNMQTVIQFVQQSGLIFKRFNNREWNNFFGSIPNNVNYIAQSKTPVVAKNFEVINRFLSSKSIVVAFFYQNQFLNMTRSYNQLVSMHPSKNVWTQCNKISF